MKVTIPKYNEEGSKIIGIEEVKVLFRVKYIGENIPLTFTNGKIYDVIEIIDSYYIRVIDDSKEDYMYLFKEPKLLTMEKSKGKFEIVEDFTGGKIKKIMDTI